MIEKMGYMSSITIQMVAALYDGGMQQCEIARVLDIRKQSVHNALHLTGRLQKKAAPLGAIKNFPSRAGQVVVVARA